MPSRNIGILTASREDGERRKRSNKGVGAVKGWRLDKVPGRKDEGKLLAKTALCSLGLLIGCLELFVRRANQSHHAYHCGVLVIPR